MCFPCCNKVEKKINKLEKKMEKIVRIKFKIQTIIENSQEDLENLEIVENEIQKKLTKLRIDREDN